MSNTLTRAPQAGITETQSFDGGSIMAVSETNQSGMSARATALAQAKFIVAMQRPRNMELVRTKMLRAVERPGFAGLERAKSKSTEAWYHKPVGDGVQGFSIRFAEEAIRCLGNIDVQVLTLLDDSSKRVIEVAVIDLEANITWGGTATIDKTVERQKLPVGEIAIRTRMNAAGKPVYTIPATADEVFMAQQNITSKMVRNFALRHVPGDILGDCRDRILAIRRGAVAADPEGFKRKVIDSFAKINITAPMVDEYLGQSIDTASPDQLQDLRDLWQDISDGKTTWAKEMAAGDPEAPKEQPKAEQAKTLDAAAEKLAARNAQKLDGPGPVLDIAPPKAEPDSVEDEEREAMQAEPAPVAAPKPAPAAKKAEPPKEEKPEDDPTFQRMRDRARGNRSTGNME